MKVVIKVGTSSLAIRRIHLGLVQQIVQLQSQGVQILLVSSGAVARGRELLHSVTSSKQTFASIGQVKLMQVWAELFSLFDLQVGQVLLTKEDFGKATQETLNGLLREKIIPIINENDTVAASQARIGNNDSLAALVARLIDADRLILLTDQEGLYTADPRLHPDAKLIPFVRKIDETLFDFAKGSSTGVGTGGMATKIEAALVASRAGIPTTVASATRPNVLLDWVGGKEIGTLFEEVR
ncbi:MAG TPA: glutamate 5-kinase [Chlamydiales bacterium]|nr:glutamate 5-kinase [Chlamydiales bacterium]